MFAEYASAEAAKGAQRYKADDSNRLHAVDVGDVCLNIDPAKLAAKGVRSRSRTTTWPTRSTRTCWSSRTRRPPRPVSRSCSARSRKYGENGWQDYWTKLKANGVKVVSGWEEAYTQEFSGPRQGRRGRSSCPTRRRRPPSRRGRQPRTKAVLDTCYRQVEYAGVLTGAKNPDDAQKVLDFLLSEKFQAQVAEQMYVYPSREGVDAARVVGRRRAAADRTRRRCPRTRCRTTGSSGSSSGAARAGLSSPHGAGRARCCRWVSSALFFAWPVLAIVRLGLREGGVAATLVESDDLGAGRVHRRAGGWRRRSWPCRRDAGGVPAGPRRICRARGGPGARAGAVRAADRRGGAGVPGVLAGRRGVADRAGQRVLQRGRRRADRRRAVGAHATGGPRTRPGRWARPGRGRSRRSCCPRWRRPSGRPRRSCSCSVPPVSAWC